MRRMIVNNVAMRILILFLFITFLSYCSDTGAREKTADEIIAASLDAIAPAALRDQFNNLVSMANCTSPSGSYTTEVNTDSGYYMYFRQQFSYKPEAFEAIILNRSKGFSAGDSLQILSPEEIAVIRGHAFHTLLFELTTRFQAFEKPVNLVEKGQELVSIRATDEQGYECILYLDSRSNRLTRLKMQNPGNREETISILWSDWKNVQGCILPHKVVIDQSGKIFVFDFKKIELNSPAFRKRELFTP